MLGPKILPTTLLLALSTAQTVVDQPLATVGTTPQLRGSDPAVDAARDNLARMEAFEAAVEELAYKYQLPIEDSPAVEGHMKLATDAMADDQRVIAAATDNVGAERSSRCQLTADAANTKQLKLSCSSDKIRFAGIGDWGEKKTSDGLTAVRDGLLKEAGNLDFVLSVGDNFYSNGVSSIRDSQWTSTWVNRYGIGSTLTVPWFSILGNHDHNGNSNAQIEYSKATEAGSKYWIMPGGFYAVDILDSAGKKLKLVVTDTETIRDADYAWIAGQIQDSQTEFVLATGHYQIYSAGERGDNKDATMTRLNRLLQDNKKVKAYMNGHEHDMQLLRSGSLDYFAFGGGGRKIDFAKKSPGTAAKIEYYQRNYGFAIYEVDIGARTMNVIYNVFDKTGKKVESKAFTRTY